MSDSPHSTLSAAKRPATSSVGFKEPPCTLFTITQFQCSPMGGRVTCWPLERVFRQCGKDKPSIEVTNRLVRSSIGDEDLDGERAIIVDPTFIENPPKARSWGDIRHT